MMNRTGIPKSKSYLEVIQEKGEIDKGLTLDEAVYELTDPLNCVECVAVEQCADVYGKNTADEMYSKCSEVVRAYLSQDYISKRKSEED